MDFVRSAISRTRKRHLQDKTTNFVRKRRPEALENSGLGKLPIEILQEIASYLSLSSTTSFALTSWAILNVVGHTYMLTIGNSWEKLGLLEKIARDLRDHVVCAECLKLHPIHDDAPPTKWIFRRKSRNIKKPIQCKDYLRVRDAIGANLQLHAPTFRILIRWLQEDPRNYGVWPDINFLWPKLDWLADSAIMSSIMPMPDLRIDQEGSLIIRKRFIVPISPHPIKLDQGIRSLNMCCKLAFSWGACGNGKVVVSTRKDLKEDETTGWTRPSAFFLRNYKKAARRSTHVRLVR
ncbi:hypothetical protein IFR05_004828 [Cadophora sp. M221]|nr:hypothetical protein IFR05_004828 [Cadophora sp. M221]